MFVWPFITDGKLTRQLCLLRDKIAQLCCVSVMRLTLHHMPVSSPLPTQRSMRSPEAWKLNYRK